MAYTLTLKPGAHTSLEVRCLFYDRYLDHYFDSVVENGYEIDNTDPFLYCYAIRIKPTIDPGYTILRGVEVNGTYYVDDEGNPDLDVYLELSDIEKIDEGVIYVYTFDAIGTERTLNIVQQTGAICTAERIDSYIGAPLGTIGNGDAIYCGDRIRIDAEASPGYELIGYKFSGHDIYHDSIPPKLHEYEKEVSGSFSDTLRAYTWNSDVTVEIFTKPKPHNIWYANFGDAAKVYAKRISSPAGNPLGVLAQGDVVSNDDVLDFYIEVYDGSTVKHLFALDDEQGVERTNTIDVTPIAGESPTYISETSFTVVAGTYDYLRVGAEFIKGRVCIDNGSEFNFYTVHIDDGTTWNQYVPYIDNGTGWDICS